MKKIFLFVIVFILLFSVPAAAEKWALIILPEVARVSPECIDPENCTVEELEAIATWQDAYDNLWGLYAKIDKADWLFEEPIDDIVYPGKGVRVTKAGQYGTAAWFPMNRILRPNPTDWFVNKVSLLRDNGWNFRGYATDDPHQELADRNFEIVGAE